VCVGKGGGSTVDRGRAGAAQALEQVELFKQQSLDAVEQAKAAALADIAAAQATDGGGSAATTAKAAALADIAAAQTTDGGGSAATTATVKQEVRPVKALNALWRKKAKSAGQMAVVGKHHHAVHQDKLEEKVKRKLEAKRREEKMRNDVAWLVEQFSPLVDELKAFKATVAEQQAVQDEGIDGAATTAASAAQR
jgi:hypothetical protein